MRIQLYINPLLHPALFQTLQSESNAKRRAALLKTFAERHLTGVQNLPCTTASIANDVTNSTPPHKYHSSAPLLTGTPAVSNGTDDVLLTGHPSVSNGRHNVEANSAETRQASVELSARSAAEGGNAAMLLTGTPLVSNTESGAGALAAVLSDQMLGLRR